MFQKALHEDLKNKNTTKPKPITLTQKHRITKKKGDSKNAQIFNDRRQVPTSAANMGAGSQFSHRNKEQIEVVPYQEQKVLFVEQAGDNHETKAEVETVHEAKKILLSNGEGSIALMCSCNPEGR